MRLIDADALIKYCDDNWIPLNITAVNAQPTIEPEPQIVRCKDCRFYQDNNGGYPHMNCKWDANETPDEDDFCSGAERKDGSCHEPST